MPREQRSVTRRGTPYRPSAMDMLRVIPAVVNQGANVYRGARAVYNAARAVANMSYSTPSRSTPARSSNRQSVPVTRTMIGKNYGSSSKGKFSKPLKVSRSYKKTKRLRGIVTVIENGGTITDPNCIFLGHTSLPAYGVLLTVVQALVKSIYYKAYGREPQNMSSDQWNLTEIGTFQFYGYSLGSSGTLTSFAVTPAAATETLYTTCVTIAGQLCSQLNTFPGFTWKFVRFYKTSTTTSTYDVEIDLEFLKVDFEVKSSLKLQNRSVPSVANQEADDVDNIPIYGKSFVARGTGLLLRDNHSNFVANNCFTSDSRHGVLTYAAATDPTQSLREPPLAINFANSSKASKVKLDPGDIKTSVLSLKKRLSFVSFMNMLSRSLIAYSAGNFKQHLVAGQTRVFAFEKLLDDGAGTNIVGAYENNTRIAVAIMSQRLQGTMQTYIKY